MLPRLTAHTLLRCCPALLGLALSACGGGDGPGLSVRMDFSRSAGLYDAPFPSDDLRRPGGGVDVGRFPNPDGIEIVKQGLALLKSDARGFALTAATYFSLSGDLGAAALPDLAGSTAPDAPVFLFDLQRRARHPVLVRYAADGGPFGAANLLSLLPVQGLPLRPGAVYAAVVRTSLLDEQGRPLSPSPSVAQLASGGAPDDLGGAASAYQDAVRTLAGAGVPAGEIAGLAVFTTDDPTAEMGVFRKEILSVPPPSPVTPLALQEVYPTYCLYSSALDLPDYQQGDAPYLHTGGGWAVDGSGKPLPPHTERARLYVTVPRTPMPAAGYPTVVLIRTGAGGDLPLTDRGVQAMHDGPPVVAGSGPAQEFARVGFAGVQVDGPLGGLRNTTNSDEQFLVFNVFNVTALRDNVRESALELILLAHLVPSFALDASGCPGASAAARLDGGHLALLGHSMGATIAPLVLTWEPLYRAAILSGAGGSYIENVLWKRKPAEILPIAESLIGYPQRGLSLTENDPVLSLLQWAIEPSDPPVYAPLVVRAPRAGEAPRHVLMVQGIIDNYILPNIADAVSLPLGLDLGGAPIDQPRAGLEGQVPVLGRLPLLGRGQIALHAGGNETAGGAPATAILVQHPEDGIEDGHEVMFQTEPPKHQYRCFLQGLARDQVPVVPPGMPTDAPCP